MKEKRKKKNKSKRPLMPTYTIGSREQNGFLSGIDAFFLSRLSIVSSSPISEALEFADGISGPEWVPPM
jgi:hypothetical protein